MLNAKLLMIRIAHALKQNRLPLFCVNEMINNYSIVYCYCVRNLASWYHGVIFMVSPFLSLMITKTVTLFSGWGGGREGEKVCALHLSSHLIVVSVLKLYRARGITKIKSSTCYSSHRRANRGLPYFLCILCQSSKNILLIGFTTFTSTLQSIVL